ncbi:hypothetical protein IV102_32950, partial [bacterium]|nr:hypothetical protein [bacterium]
MQSAINKAAKREGLEGADTTTCKTSQTSIVRTHLVDESQPVTMTQAGDSQTRWKLSYPNQEAESKARIENHDAKGCKAPPAEPRTDK